MLQKFKINFAQNPGLTGVEPTSYAVQLIWPGLGQISYTTLYVVRFYTLQFKIL